MITIPLQALQTTGGILQKNFNIYSLSLSSDAVKLGGGVVYPDYAAITTVLFLSKHLPNIAL